MLSFNYIISRCLLALIVLSSCKNKWNKQANTHPLVKTMVKAPALDSSSLVNDLAYLSSGALEGRETGSNGNNMAREYIINRYKALKLKMLTGSWVQQFPFKQTIFPAANIIAAVTGTQQPDRYIVVSAHYDHLGVKDGTIYYGADDNASGTACLLALAAYFRQHAPLHSVLFAAFDAEEKGLAGSTWFIQHPPVPLNTIVLNINMDMISRNDKNEIYVSGAHHYPFLKQYIDSVRSRTSVNVLIGHDDPAQGHDDWTNQSDHYPFHKAAIPFLYFGVEDHPDYHKPSDTFDKINQGFYYQTAEMIRKAIVVLDKHL